MSATPILNLAATAKPPSIGQDGEIKYIRRYKIDTAVKATKLADRWTLDIKVPYKDVNAKNGFGFTVIRNRHAAGSRGCTGGPSGGAYFKTDRYIRCRK